MTEEKFSARDIDADYRDAIICRGNRAPFYGWAVDIPASLMVQAENGSVCKQNEAFLIYVVFVVLWWWW